MGIIKKGPDVSTAATVGEPTLVDADPMSAREVLGKEVGDVMASMAPNSGRKGATIEIVKPDQPAGTSATPPSDAVAAGGSPFGRTAGAADNQPAAPDPNELKPNAPADPNELKPTDSGTDQTLPPPVQVNEIQQGQTAGQASQGQSSSSSTAAADNTPASDQELSSSKKKKKTGIRKIIPF